MSHELLHILADRKRFQAYGKYIKTHFIQQNELRNIINVLKDWYAKDSRSHIDWGEFQLWFKTVKFPNLSSAQSVLYDKIFEVMEATPEPTSDTYKEILHSFILRDFGRQIGEIGLKAHDGDIDNLDDILSLIDIYNKETETIIEKESNEVSTDIIQIIAKVTTGGLDWKLNFFNRSLGPLRIGDFVVIASRSEVGKTTLLCSEINNFAKQIPKNKKILVFNNEGDGAKYRLRCIQCELDILTRDIQKNPKDAQTRFNTAIGDPNKIVIVDKAILTTNDVEQKIKEHDPAVIVFDQLYKVHGFTKEAGRGGTADVNRQAMLFQWGRELAKAYAPVITVHQADYTAEGEKWLNASQLYGSKTAIQGEADVIVMIGKSHDITKQDIRYFSVVKNKLIGGPKSDPAERHGKTEIQLIAETGQWKE